MFCLEDILAVNLNFIKIYSSNVKKPSFPIFLPKNYSVLAKTSCYEDWNTLLHFASISVVQWEYPGR